MRIHYLAIGLFIFISLLILSNNVETATETSNATFTLGNDPPTLVHVSATTNATRIYANWTHPTNVSQFVNFTANFTEINAEAVAILVCRTASASANGCTDAQYYINETTFSTANHSALNKTTLDLASFPAYYNDTNSTIAYLFLSDGQAVSSSKNVSFSVNHAPTMTNPAIEGTGGATNYTNETYTAALRNLYDVDNGNNTVGFSGYKPIYKWFIVNDSNWYDTGVTVQTFDCSSEICKNGDVLRVQVLAQDLHGYSNSSSGPFNSTNMTIADAPPLPPTAFQVKDGTGNWDSTVAYDTHARNGTGPEISWTDGSDPDSNINFTYVCAMTNPVNNVTADTACDDGTVFNTSRVDNGTEYVTIGGTMYNTGGSVNTTYIALVTSDGTSNSTILNVTLYINNSKPIVDPTPLNITITHDSTPVVEWNVTDYDDGKIDGWPPDTLQHFVRVGSTIHGSDYNSSGKANNNSYEILPVIPWNTTVEKTAGLWYWSNRTVFFDVWVNDSTGTTYGNSTLVQDNFTLYDYLPRIVHINMSNDQAASPYLSCNQTGAPTLCQLTPVEFSNTTVAIHLTIIDRDGDCSAVNHRAWVSLCTNQSADEVCAAGSGDDYRFNLSLVTTGANTSICFFQRTSNQTILNSPEFFINNTHYKLFANISNNGSVVRFNESLENGSWFYVGLNAVNYSTAVTLGNESVQLGAFSFGKNKYVVRNYGNLNLSLRWNMSDPTVLGGGGSLWPLDDSDVLLDDDNNVTSEAEGVIPTTNILRNDTAGAIFDPLGIHNFAHCVTQNCSLLTWNETLDTYWHINPPTNLSGGTYAATIWLISSS